MLSQLHEYKQAISQYHRQMKVDHGIMVEEQHSKWNKSSVYYLNEQNKEALKLLLRDTDSRKG